MSTSNETTSVRHTVLEVADSVTGFEEIEVTNHFGRPLADLQLSDSAMWARALAYVVKRREGLVDVDAKAAVLGMSIKAIWDTFEDESAESGKDESSAETPLESLPPSAS